ncbi:MAG: VapC toxin family PIN domain ribonuclease [Rhodanobacteraceae bacterium]|nr:VapC toxin family PIN domain ribonuclease [Rhodanobacteraceae bacterium]
MGVIFDSCIWIALGAGELSHETVISTCGDAPVYASAVSLGELRFGVESCVDPGERARRGAYLRQVERRPVVAVTRHTASAFGVLAATVRRIAGSGPLVTEAAHRPVGYFAGHRTTSRVLRMRAVRLRPSLHH